MNQSEAMEPEIKLRTPAAKALEELQTYAQTINVPDTRAEVCDKIRQLKGALRFLASRNHVLEFKN